jgi:membrane-associated phospholipid phosphatase
MLKLLKANRNYVLPFIILLIITLIILLFVKKGQEVIWLNRFYDKDLNTFFVWITRLGEEWVAIGIGLILLLKAPMRTFFGYLASMLMVSAFVNFFKHFVFDDAVRPKLFLSEYTLKFVENVYINTMNSFPSGHTATAFAVFTYIAFALKPRFKSWIIILPVLAGLSRIYLAQHFLIDVIAGSILGFFMATLSFWIFHNEESFHRAFWNKKILK